MNKFLFLPSLLLLLSGVNLTAQITIDLADFPSADDTAMISLSDDLSVDYTTTGADILWDYSTINISNQRIDTFYDVSDASLLLQISFNNFLDPDYDSDYYNNFLGFDLSGAEAAGLEIGNTTIFTKYESGSGDLNKTGLGMNINGVEIPAQYSVIDTEYKLPIDYGNSWFSYSFLDIDLNPAFNGIFRRHQNRTALVDGWGTINTWYGTFDVIRVKMDYTYSDSVYIDLGGTGTWLELPTPDQHEYIWWSNGQKVPIMKIVTTGPSGTEIVTRVEFKDIDRGFLSEIEEELKIGVYPNPSNDMIYFSASENIQFVELIEMNGQVVRQQQIKAKEGSMTVSDLSSGVYLLKVHTSNRISVQQVILKQGTK